jgi:hypothetical protein
LHGLQVRLLLPAVEPAPVVFHYELYVRHVTKLSTI